MADNKHIIDYFGWKRFWGKENTWLQSLFQSIKDKIDAIVIPDPDLSAVAKEANATANKEAIISAVNNAQPDLSSVAKQGQDQTATLTAIKELLAGGGDPDIPEGVAERLAAIMQFFNISGTVPDYHAMTTAEVLEIADDVWDAMYGFVAVPNTLHTVNPLGQQVEIATYFKPSRTYGDYGFPELWAQNDQQQWVSILNDYPTADRDIYTYNPSNNE